MNLTEKFVIIVISGITILLRMCNLYQVIRTHNLKEYLLLTSTGVQYRSHRQIHTQLAG